MYKEHFENLSADIGQHVLELIPSGTPIQCYYNKCVTCGLFPFNYGTVCKNISQQNICIQDVKDSSISSNQVDFQCNFGANPSPEKPSLPNSNISTNGIVIIVILVVLFLSFICFTIWKKKKNSNFIHELAITPKLN